MPMPGVACQSAVAPTTTSVVFGARRRPEDATEIRLPEWEGPLGLLLALVEARRLDVLAVPLGALAEAYLDALATLQGDRLGNISVFVGVASQLILIKSRALLPRPPAPGVPLADECADPEAELRARLLLYRVYRDAGAALQARALTGALLVRREPGVAAAAGRTQGVARDAPRLDVALLVRALDRLAAVVPAPTPAPISTHSHVLRYFWELPAARPARCAACRRASALMARSMDAASKGRRASLASVAVAS
jgi:chromatin segregation and condensation protein Rec8/ScpA/Scc1 (kleisin family)